MLRACVIKGHREVTQNGNLHVPVLFVVIDFNINIIWVLQEKTNLSYKALVLKILAKFKKERRLCYSGLTLKYLMFKLVTYQIRHMKDAKL